MSGRARRTHPHRSTRAANTRRGLTLIELIAVLLVVGLLATWWLTRPRLCYLRERSTRLVCAGILKIGIGASLRIYASDHNGAWPVPAFDDSPGVSVDYTFSVGGGGGTRLSPDRTQPSVGGPGGATELSNTRAFWMLVRSGDVVPKSLICQESGDTPDDTKQIPLYYDFAGIENISYGFHMPYGPPESRPRDGADNRLVWAADKGPYVDPSVPTPPSNLAIPDYDSSNSRDQELRWRPFNSRHHGGEGQNVLFADGHVSFKKVPLVGIDRDNIYTVAVDGGDPSCITAGESPWVRHAPPLVRIDAATGKPVCTDSVIFP